MKKLLKSRKYLKLIFSILVIASILTPALIYLPKRVSAATCTWSGGSGAWETAGNWSNCGGGVPGAGDDVTIDANVTIQLNGTTTINSLTLGNASGTTSPTLNFNYDAVTLGALLIDDGNAMIYQNATITHTDATTVVVGKIFINVQTGTFTLNGNIDVTGKGYRGGYWGNATTSNGAGTGGGTGTPAWADNGAGGGAYGGDGASGTNLAGGTLYGSTSTPSDMGSGGGAGVGPGSHNCSGGDGGGFIKLNVYSTLTIAGSISANGNSSACHHGGSGAGGGIYFSAGNLAGSGIVQSKGGTTATDTQGRQGGDGGGGRIGLNYTGTNSFTGSINITTGSGPRQGEMGTAYIRNTTYNDLTIPTKNNVWYSSSFENWNIRNLTINDDITFASSNAQAYTFTVRGTTTIGENVDITLLSSYTANTNGIGVLLNLRGNITIPSTSSINADGQGYRGGISSDTDGDGPGRSTVWGGGNSSGGGAGYGGAGGAGSRSAGTSYGSSSAPIDLGSGGGWGVGPGTHTCNGGSGGGAIKISTDGTLTVNGTLSANGINTTCEHAGGGSGGSIYLIVDTLAGTGTLTAVGGSVPTNDSPQGGGGGGGRIAIQYKTTNNWSGNSLTAAVATAGGTAGAVPGANGSVLINQATSGYVLNLDGSLDSVKATDWNTNIENPVNAQTGIVDVGIQDTSGQRLAEFSAFFNGNRDWNNVTAETDGSNKSFFHVPSGFSNLDGYDIGYSTFKLYIPKGSRDTAVWICPNVDNLNDITTDCAGGYMLTEESYRVEIENINGQDYWVVSELSSTGGLGINTSGTPNMRVDLANEATSATDDIEVWFDTPTDITADSLIYVIYDSLFTGGSSLTLSDISLNCDADGLAGGTSTGMTSFSLAQTPANGYLVIDTNTDTCSNWIQVDIQGGGGNHLTNPGSPGNYSWAVLTDVSGDGIDDDSGATLAYVGDDNDVNITAIVPPTIDMELYQQGTDTELTDTNTCALGVLSLNQVNTCIYDLGTGTNNSTGVSVYMTSDGSLDDGNGNSIGSPTGAVTSGEEEYGFYLSELGGGEYTAAGSYSTQHQAVPTTVTLIASTSTTGSGTTVGSSSQHIEITHAASMSTSTIVGSYNQVVTYTAYTN